MKECTDCSVSALCFSLGRKAFLDQVHECSHCKRTFYKDQIVSLPCFVFWEILNLFGDESISRKRYESGRKPMISVRKTIVCDACADKMTVYHNKKKGPTWLP